MPSSPEAWYDAWYFRHCCGRPYDRSQERYRVFGRITDRITADIGPRAVVVTDDWVDEAVCRHRRIEGPEKGFGGGFLSIEVD